MEVFRITLSKWSNALIASGNSARWNSNGMRVIYAAQSRSLACLENVVHRTSLGLNNAYKVMVISIPDSLEIEIIQVSSLPPSWNESARCHTCRTIGDDWLKSQKTPILKVPSALIKYEYNYLINPLHSDFQKIQLIRTEDFEFDNRIKMI